MFQSAIPVVHVSNSRKAEDFYCNGLGFRLLSAWRPNEANDDPCYMTLSRDAATLHVASFRDGVFGAWNSTVYVFVDDVNALYAELAGKGISTMSEPVDQTWGTREVGVRDPDKNVITFGQRKACP